MSPGSGHRDPDPEIDFFLAGDVMIGRGVDQVLPRSAPPDLHEPRVRSARRYVELAERASGPVPARVEPGYPWGDLLPELRRREPSVRVVNLETAVTAGGEPWSGKRIHYRTHPANTSCLSAAGVDVAVLANNHVLDWGYGALRETLAALEEAGVATAGAGLDREEARSPARVDLGAGRVLVFALATPGSGVPREWAAGPGQPGVSLLPDLDGDAARDLGRRIRDRRRTGDLVLVSLHWGGNWGHRIPDGQRRFARRLIDDAGADLVHGHSSHHPKGLELHAGRLILYGCGDLLNDYEGIRGHEEYRPGLRLAYFPSLGTASGRLRGLEMHPYRARRFRLERASLEEARWLRDTLEEKSGGPGSDLALESGEGGRLRLR